MAEKLAGITEAFDAFIHSIEEGRYFDAHNNLESLWYPRRFDKDDEVLLWKGFISAAVCFELLKRGRPDAAETAWKTYTKYRPLLETLVMPRKELYVKIDALIQNRRTLCLNS